MICYIMKHLWQQKSNSEVGKNTSSSLWNIDPQVTSKLHNRDVTFGSGTL